MHPRSSTQGASVTLHAITHQGFIRKGNEDRFFSHDYGDGAFLICVADGMGGEPEGAQAAEIAIESLKAFDPSSSSPQNDLVESIKRASREILQRVAENKHLEGMGTTMTVVFRRAETAYWAHLGDSRFYLFREGKLRQVTEDHTPPGLMLRDGKLSAEEARVHPLRNVLFECVGCQDSRPDKGRLEVQPGDLLLLSTDGLHDQITEDQLIAILRADHAPQAKLEALLQAALDAGGRDNITAVVAQI